MDLVTTFLKEDQPGKPGAAPDITSFLRHG